MGMMELRRKVMAYHPAQSAVGIFTKGYEATLKPGATNSFVIQHNLGIMPRLCIIEMDRSMAQLTNYAVNVIIDFNVYGMSDDKTGYEVFLYHYNNGDNQGGNPLPISIVSANENAITLGPPYSYTRSLWDTAVNYSVRVWG